MKRYFTEPTSLEGEGIESYTDYLEGELLGMLLSENGPEPSSLTQACLRGNATTVLSESYIDEMIALEQARKKALLYSSTSRFQLLIYRDMMSADKLFSMHHYKDAAILYRAIVKTKTSPADRYRALYKLAECVIESAANKDAILVCLEDFPEISFKDLASKKLNAQVLELLLYIKIL